MFVIDFLNFLFQKMISAFTLSICFFGPMWNVMAELHEVKPREQAGRDTLERYNAQIRAASIACLSILEGKDVKRVFCEFHDDFVVERVVANDIHYTFVQVKTKEKLREIWKLREVFGILKRKAKKTLKQMR